jgi:hypothetical protein
MLSTHVWYNALFSGKQIACINKKKKKKTTKKKKTKTKTKTKQINKQKT